MGLKKKNGFGKKKWGFKKVVFFFFQKKVGVKMRLEFSHQCHICVIRVETDDNTLMSLACVFILTLLQRRASQS